MKRARPAAVSAALSLVLLAGLGSLPAQATPSPVPAAVATVDRTAPVTVIAAGPGQGSVSTSSSASFTFNSSEPSRFQCRVNSAPFAICPNPLTLTGLGLGVKTLQVRAVDRAGNVDATPEQRVWTVVAATPGASKPQAWNTGVPAGTALRRHDGNLTITKAGTVIDAMDIRGFVRVQAPNVTIKRSIVRGGRTTVGTGLVMATTATATNLVIEDSELVPQYVSPWLDGIKGGNFTLRRVESRSTVDNVGIHMSNVRIESSWLHSSSYFAQSPAHNGTPSHNDVIQVHGGKNLRIIGNTLQGAHQAALMLQQNYSPTSDVLVERNWMDNGSCTVNVNHKGGTSMSGITVRNNRFGRHGTIADCAIIATSASNLATSGNVWDDTGTAVRIRRG